MSQLGPLEVAQIVPEDMASATAIRSLGALLLLGLLFWGALFLLMVL